MKYELDWEPKSYENIQKNKSTRLYDYIEHDFSAANALLFVS